MPVASIHSCTAWLWVVGCGSWVVVFVSAQNKCQCRCRDAEMHEGGREGGRGKERSGSLTATTLQTLLMLLLLCAVLIVWTKSGAHHDILPRKESLQFHLALQCHVATDTAPHPGCPAPCSACWPCACFRTAKIAVGNKGATRVKSRRRFRWCPAHPTAFSQQSLIAGTAFSQCY